MEVFKNEFTRIQDDLPSLFDETLVLSDFVEIIWPN